MPAPRYCTCQTPFEPCDDPGHCIRCGHDIQPRWAQQGERGLVNPPLTRLAVELARIALKDGGR